MQTPCGGPGASRARAASPGLCGVRTAPPTVSPDAAPWLMFLHDSVYRGLLKSVAGDGEASHWADLFRGRRCRRSRRCALQPRGAGTVHGPALLLRGLETYAWEPRAGGKPESAEGTGALGKPISAAQAESAAVVLTGKGSPPAHCQALDRVPLEAECPTPAGHHRGNRQERTCLLPPLEKWCPSWV